MANIPIFPGSSSFSPGQTPFGFYDTDVQFQSDADKVSVFCARRLGYPLVDIELQDINFYAAFEEAITTYGNEIYAYKIRQDLIDVVGGSTGSSHNDAIITPNLGRIINISKQYGSEIGTGGNVDWHSGSINLIRNQQNYDLDIWASSSASLNPGDSIEIKEVYYQGPPAITRFFDPYASTGVGAENSTGGFGFGNATPATDFLMMPLNFDLQRIQAIELNDQIRRSNYSFDLVNNNLKVFPIPNESGNKLWFRYIKQSERIANSIDTSGGTINNVSNVPYTNPTYTFINSVGRSWIFEYTLALCKEMLGYVRGKYDTIPIPGSSVQLNEGDLIAAATAEKNALIERLRAYLDETSREKMMERKSLETEYRKKELNEIPQLIYIG